MKLDHLIYHENLRQIIFKGLAECFYLPQTDLELRLKKIEQALTVLGSEALPKAILMRSSFLATTVLEELKVDYAMLFAGPFLVLAPPYGSIYLEGERRLMGDSTLDARNRYRAAGLDLSGDFKEAPDHIAVELEFMHFISFKALEALKSNEFDIFIEQIRRQHSFLQDHLGSWVDAFCQKIEKHAQTDFYRHLGSTTRLFITGDLKEICQTELIEPIVGMKL